MPDLAEQFAPFAERMRAEGLPKIAIETFRHYYHQLTQGQTGLIPEAQIQPVTSLPDAETLPQPLTHIGYSALAKTILLKLNGGLGTSMGLSKAKSLLPVKNGLTFLDIIARQALRVGCPLVLMNSFNTQADSLAALKTYPGLSGNIPLDFTQHKIPKITQADLSPAEWPTAPELTWCPPGHGDIYTALVTSGMLDTLLSEGYAYAFVSNADNLGATIDPAILGYFVDTQAPFMMEVADRTEADKKGGHLAQQAGHFILRESAQCPADDLDTFQDVSRHRYFNTNNLWLNLPALKQTLIANNNILGLPMIRNAKTVDPADSQSTPVYQLETAMGAAIGIFSGAQAIRVPRTRFAPVKTTNDLLAIRSDAYLLTEDYHITPNPARHLTQLVINLDPRYYKLIADMEARFPADVPSLLHCTRLTVQGDIQFEAEITLRGEVTLINEGSSQGLIKAGAGLEGECRY